jgi:hypothetical protein
MRLRARCSLPETGFAAALAAVFIPAAATANIYVLGQ